MPAFSPSATVTLSGTTTTSNIILPVSAGSRQVLCQNAGAVPAFVEFGTSSVAATVAASTPILAGGSRLFTIGSAVTHVATITGSSTATVYVTAGRGEASI